MQDLEFTIQEGKLWMLQTRNGKRTGAAMVRIAMEMLQQGMIDEKTALQRVAPDRLNDLLHPIFDPEALKAAQGHRARPAGVARRGQRADRVLRRRGRGMGQAGQGGDPGAPGNLARRPARHERGQGHPHRARRHDLARRGGGARHGQVLRVGRRRGARRPQGAHDDASATRPTREGEWISLNGSTGEVFAGRIATKDAELSGDFGALMALADRYKRLEVRANADTPDEAAVARRFGATGIGLCRTEHMFFEGERINAVREMILADDEAGRRKALAKLLPMQRGDFEGLFREMSGLPVTIRLLDPPLHEFVPHDEAGQRVMAAADEGLAGQDQDARGGPARVQPDARPPRLPAGHHLPRDHRDAGARHLRGRR